jgi:hypothetical protein
MPTEIKLPNLGEGVDSGDVLELLVKEGDTVAKEQGIVELETGKATLQVPSSAAGKILKIHVKPGQTIAPGVVQWHRMPGYGWFCALAAILGSAGAASAQLWGGGMDHGSGEISGDAAR